MALITLLTDSGDSDFYVSAIKAKISSINPGIRVEDISHSIGHGNVAHAAFVLNAVFRDFPKGTVHLVGVDATGQPGAGHVAMQLEDHFFVACNNGILSLISDKNPQYVAELNTLNLGNTTFPEKEILAPAAAKIASGVSLSDLGRPSTNFRRLTIRHLKANKSQILGHVIHVDHFGNLITNISSDVFTQLSPGKNYVVQFAGERISRLHTNYNQVDPGDCFVLFNSQGLLEIGVYKGDASRLLGLQADSPVNIIFQD